jgi:hypothetical protein
VWFRFRGGPACSKHDHHQCSHKRSFASTCLPFALCPWNQSLLSTSFLTCLSHLLHLDGALCLAALSNSFVARTVPGARRPDLALFRLFAPSSLSIQSNMPFLICPQILLISLTFFGDQPESRFSYCCRSVTFSS